MIHFILNNKLIKTDKSGSSILLDFIRYDQHLKGTKIGCREGDCGACTVLVGTLIEGEVFYQSMNSCLTPLGNISGKHVVTIEGINSEDLTPVQAALENHSGTQCGFCTPGFVVSLTGHSVKKEMSKYDDAINSVAGNICRCTGYKSIEKAIGDIVVELKDKPETGSIDWLIEHQYLPDYFKSIPKRIANLTGGTQSFGKKIIGGGTDLYVQKADETSDSGASFYLENKELKSISIKDEYIILGASVTANEIMHSEIFNTYFPKIKEWFLLISSEQIRNVGTVAGNFVNASPIGDLSIFFLALNAELIMMNAEEKGRIVALKDFFKAYKTLDLNEGEYIEKIQFRIPVENSNFNFEKVSKRTYLDIASVNSAILYKLNNTVFQDVHISGGGLAPIPKYFEKTRSFLLGKELNRKNLNLASEILQSEVSPISDIRGSKEYKLLLLKQLFFAHFEQDENVN